MSKRGDKIKEENGMKDRGMKKFRDKYKYQGGPRSCPLQIRDSHVRVVDASGRNISTKIFVSPPRSSRRHSPARRGEEGNSVLLRCLSACRKTNDLRGKTAPSSARTGGKRPLCRASTADRLRNGRLTRKRPRFFPSPSATFRYLIPYGGRPW